jgi:hypothetical protein
VPRRFALDQNFPEPIVDGLVDWLASDAELMPIRRIDEAPRDARRLGGPAGPPR